METKKLDISISIVNYFTSDLVFDLVRSIVEGTKETTFEILISNNSPSDSLAKTLLIYPAVRITTNTKNLYFTAADNQNFRRSQGDFVASINPDIVVPKFGIDTIVKFLRKRPDIGAVTPRIEYANGDVQPSISPFINRRYALFEVTGFRLFANWGKKIMPLLPQYDVANLCYGDVLYGAFIVFRREIIVNVGLKDERLQHGWDEYDFCRRITGAGYLIAYYPSVTVIHIRSASVKRIPKLSPELRILNKKHLDGLLYLVRKYFGFASYLLLFSAAFVRKIGHVVVWTLKKANMTVNINRRVYPAKQSGTSKRF